ncbi:FMN-linked oxidoreductase [Pisolithus croceorrhizus]|nr:FMN-linked oxidoreductase [Pisolithus croceorrhizus]
MSLPDLTYVSAPMVNQSDAPFRLLTRRYGATLTYTQMLEPFRLLNDREYLEFHLRDIQAQIALGSDGDVDDSSSWNGYARPLVVQLCGNDPELVVKAARQVQTHCDGIGGPSDLNLGCPQEHAREGHFGGYLLGKQDWPLVQSMVSSMSHSLLVPTSTKIRLCPSSDPRSATATFGQLLEHAGASWVTLHARHVSAKRRRQGAADLDAVRALKETLSIPVISNGNVRTFDDVRVNLEYTLADGAMVGEALLGNPKLFAADLPDPVLISLEYLDICKRLPDVTPLNTIRTHVRRFIEFQCSRRPWYPKFRGAISECQSIGDIENLLHRRVARWRGKTAKVLDSKDDDIQGLSDVQVREGHIK